MAIKIKGKKHNNLSDAEKDGDGNTFVASVQNEPGKKGVVVYRIASGLTIVNGVQEKVGSVRIVLEPAAGGNPEVAAYLIGLNVRRDGWGELATWHTDLETYESWPLTAAQGWSRKLSDGNLSTQVTSSVDAQARAQITVLLDTINELKRQLDGLERYSESRDAVYERLETRLAQAGEVLSGG